MNVPGYEKLAEVLERAYEQASGGKGHERHANGLPFHEQPMQTINREQGSIDGFLFQARKKAIEARGLPAPRAQAELLGAINYLAGAVIALDSWAAGTLPASELSGVQPLRSKPDLVSLPVVDPEPKPWYPDDRNWIEVADGRWPEDRNVLVDVLLKEEREDRLWYAMPDKAGNWWREDVVAYTTEVPK